MTLSISQSRDQQWKSHTAPVSPPPRMPGGQHGAELVTGGHSGMTHTHVRASCSASPVHEPSCQHWSRLRGLRWTWLWLSNDHARPACLLLMKSCMVAQLIIKLTSKYISWILSEAKSLPALDSFKGCFLVRAYLMVYPSLKDRKNPKNKCLSTISLVRKDGMLLHREKRCIPCLLSLLSITCNTHLKTCIMLSTQFILFFHLSYSCLSMSKYIAN